MAEAGFTPIRVAVLASQSAPGIDALIADPNRGRLYNIAAVLGTECDLAQSKTLEAAGIPLILRPFVQFQRDRGLSLRNLRAREEYDHETAEQLQRLNIDHVFLSGYRYIVTDPLLAAFPMRVVALHEGDLTLIDEDGSRRYTGPHAVSDAIIDGRDETRSTMYFITRDIGCGPVFLLSDPFPVAPMAIDARTWGDADLLFAYAELHRRWMVRAAWGSMLAKAIEFLAIGTVQIVRDIAWIDGVPGPCRLGHSPAICSQRQPAISRSVPASCPLIHD